MPQRDQSCGTPSLSNKPLNDDIQLQRGHIMLTNQIHNRHGQPGPDSRPCGSGMGRGHPGPHTVQHQLWFPVPFAGCWIGPKSDPRVSSRAISPPHLHLLKCHEKAENTRGKIACAKTRSHLTVCKGGGTREPQCTLRCLPRASPHPLCTSLQLVS